MEYDKKLHLACGFAIAIIGGIIFSVILGLTLGIAAGIGKEVYDYYDYGLFDKDDMLYTWAGAVLGCVLVWLYMMYLGTG